MDEITININLLDRPYRLSVARADEEKVRKAGNLINERIKYYSKHYAYKDVQDLLSWVGKRRRNPSRMSS